MNGCHNRPAFPALIPIPTVYPISIDGHRVNAVAHEMQAFPFARHCVYQLNDQYNDPGCVGCTHKDTKE